MCQNDKGVVGEEIIVTPVPSRAERESAALEIIQRMEDAGEIDKTVADEWKRNIKRRFRR